MTTTTPAPKPALRPKAGQREDRLATFIAGDFIASCQCRATARKAETDQNG